MSQTRPDPARPESLVLFDGVCNFCNGAVNFIIDRDPGGRFRFAPLQSETAAALLKHNGVEIPAGGADTMILIEGGRIYDRSTAALRIARGLRMPWPLVYALIVVPRPIRDAFYRYFARNRYRWFGKSESCRMPTPELRARFLS
jgi:predicted DCC family thiol-disulfide oxidoreductase YuxK